MDNEIDVISLFNEYEISFKESGKNVSHGWINLEICPFCGDSSFHCGINLESTLFHCWVCDEKGSIWKLLHEIESLKNKNIGAILRHFTKNYDGYIHNDNKLSLDHPATSSNTIFQLPQGTLDHLPEPHIKYLQSRNFNTNKLIAKYKLQAIYNTGDKRYRFRIIVPIFINHKIVSFVAASILRDNKEIIPYLNCAPEESIIPVNHCLYNYDSIDDFACIVEGVTDVWRMGGGTVASFRKGMTSEQISLLIKKHPKKIFIMYDPDAIDKSYALAGKLCGLFDHVEILELDNKDPAELNEEEVNVIKQRYFYL